MNNREIATIKVEIIIGTTIETAFEESIRLAKLLNVWIEFNFNDVNCIAKSSSNKQLGVENYRKAIRDDSEYKFAIA
jgi:hypothetical protein